ncbi:MAG: DUF1998 domain-containing protein, partial [Candidatus Heimdallarchaeota archaeon]|nr:DUF1998 domain-containing protein [Candidatus Heimdallarchaeota archaeon]
TGITSFTQRIGRAGRKGQESYATLVFRGDDPISAYYARYPEEYFSDIPPAYVEENNPIIRNYQTKFMLLDMPLTKEEGIKYQDALSELFDKDELISNNRTIRLKNPDKTRKEISNYSIRGIGKSVSIWHLKKEIGKRNQPLAIRELHPGAIYLNAGKAYKVKKYSNITQTAEVSSILSKNQKTQALRYITPTIIEVFQENNINGIASAYCKLQLEETVTGYIKQNIFNNELIGTYNLEIPVTYTFQTVGFLISLPQPEDIISDVFDFEKENTLGGSFHAIEHVLIESANSITGGGANEIGGISMGDSGLIFVYDGAEGGSGLSKLLYNDLNKGLLRSLKIMNECPCKRIDGCPRCTYSYQCGNNNQPLNRLGAIEVLNKYGKENTELQYNFEGYPSYVIDPTYRPF